MNVRLWMSDQRQSVAFNPTVCSLCGRVLKSMPTADEEVALCTHCNVRYYRPRTSHDMWEIDYDYFLDMVLELEPDSSPPTEPHIVTQSMTNTESLRETQSATRTEPLRETQPPNLTESPIVTKPKLLTEPSTSDDVVIGVQKQPPPITTPESVEVTALVIADLEARRALGIKTYGTPLMTYNGRDAFVDAYHELLDLCVYLRQYITERSDNDKR